MRKRRSLLELFGRGDRRHSQQFNRQIAHGIYQIGVDARPLLTERVAQRRSKVEPLTQGHAGTKQWRRRQRGARIGTKSWSEVRVAFIRWYSEGECVGISAAASDASGRWS